jgi:hypothetical protein
MKLFNRDSIAADIEFKIFRGKTVWSLAFKPAEGINFVVGPTYSYRRIFEKLENNVKEKLRIQGANLTNIFLTDGRELNYKNSDELMREVILKELPLIFKIMIKGKYYEFQLEH